MIRPVCALVKVRLLNLNQFARFKMQQEPAAWVCRLNTVILPAPRMVTYCPLVP